MKRKTVLIIDDEWNMRNLLKIHLSNHFKVLEASSGKEALSLIEKIDLVVLDIMMPDMDGWEVCEKIRKTSQVPILMLTARGDVKDKVQGFESGADDYLVKPFEPEELLVRLNALLRRSNYPLKQNESQNIQYGDLKIKKESRQVLINNFLIDLTPKEFELLLLLSMNPKKVFTREFLLDHIWGEHEVLDYRTVDSHIKNLREKLRKGNISFSPIKTVWGVGYRFEGQEDV
jgi:two-component system, OmpR family, response regulator ResD